MTAAPQRGRGGGRWLRYMGLAAVVAGSLTHLHPAAAAQMEPSGRIDLASQTPWVAAAGAFELRVDVSDVRRPDEVELVVALHDAVTSRSQFTRTLEGRLLGRAIHRVSAPISELDFDAAGALRVSLPLQNPSLPPDPGRLPSLRAGVYPVDVSLRAEGRRIDGFTTHLVRVPDAGDAPPLMVAWIQPVHAPLALRPGGGHDISPRRLDELATVAAALARSRLPLSIEPLPETIEALAALGREDILSDLRRSLEARQVLTKPYVDVDVDAVDDLPGELAAQRARAGAVLASTLRVRPDPRAWSQGDALSPDAVEALTALGVDRLVAPESSFTPLSLQLTLAQPFVVETPDGDSLPAMAIDAALQEHFTGDDQVLAAHHLLADLAVLFYDAPGTRRGVVVRPPERWRPDDALLSVALSGLSTSPVLEAATVDSVFDRVQPLERQGDPVARRPVGEPGPGLPADAILAARDAQEGFRAMVGVDNEITDVLDRLVLASQAAPLRGEARRSYLDGARRLLDVQLERIRLLDSSYRLTAREGTLPMTLVNENPYPVTVQMRLASEKLEFRESGEAGDHALTVELAGQNTALAVPVRARTPGAFQLRVVLSSPDGRLEVARTRVTVRSTFVSGVGVVLSAGAGAFLLLWWARHWRTARRDRRLVGSPS